MAGGERAAAAALPDRASGVEAAEDAPSGVRHFLAEVVRSPKGLSGFVVLVLALATAALAPWLAPHDPAEQVIAHRFLPPAYAEGGTAALPLGGDNLGRDILSRVIHGTRTSVVVALVVITVIVLIGTAVGLVSGYYGGVVDTVLMRIVDFQLSFPFILLALLLLAILGKGFWTLVLALSVAFWINIARLVRGEALRLRELDFVQASRSIGVADGQIILQHLLPNALPTLIVLATLDVAVIVIAEAAMSFLGLGIQPPTPSWGMMISDGRNYLYESYWMTLAPGLAIMVTAIGVNLLGDFLRDTYDPRLARL
ncbi:MAG: ABC transporter permease [Candidatus Rokuibacteriota bacterium]